MPKLTAHPSREELSAYSLGQLPEERAVDIDTHISQCEPCCETIVELSSEDTFAGLLQEAGRLQAELTLDSDGSTAKSSSTSEDIPTPLAEHPRYQIVRLIGKGGMGDVYEARHRMMERTVALKVIAQRLMRKPEAVDRFHREVKAAAQLAHPNVVTAYDAEQAGDMHFMVMEFVDGVDLSQLAKDRGALPVADACAYICQAAIGLQHAHERGMVHRDIKPHNLMVTSDGTVKILDFGLASLAPKAMADADAVEARGDLTAAGAIMGTPDFISPEQADDARTADIRSDIYSLGATLYFLLSARPPFAEGSVMHKLKSHAQSDPEPLDTVRLDVPADLAVVIKRMMEKDPDQRFQTPEELAEALQPFSRSTEPREIVESPTQAKPHRWMSTFLSLAAVAVLFVAAIFAGLGHFGVRFEARPPAEDTTTLGTHRLTIVDASGKKPYGGTSGGHQNDATGITTHTYESANGRYKITLIDDVLTVNGEKYTLENPTDAIRIVDDRVEITQVTSLPDGVRELPADGNQSVTASTSTSQPELKVTDKTVNKGTAGLPSVYDWSFRGRDVGDLKVRLLLAQNGKTEVIQEFDYDELPAEFANKVRLQIKDAARSPKGRRVSAILFVESPVPSRSSTVNEDKGLSIDVEAPFSNRMERADLGPIEPGQTELLMALSYWKGDMTHDHSMESMTAATESGIATFLFVTLEWSPASQDVTTATGGPDTSPNGQPVSECAAMQVALREYYMDKYPLFAASVNQNSNILSDPSKLREREWMRQINELGTNSPVSEVINSFPGKPYVTFTEVTQASRSEVLVVCVNLYRNADETCRVEVTNKQRKKRAGEPVAVGKPITEEIVRKLIRRVAKDFDFKQLQGDWEAASVTEGGKQLTAKKGFSSLLLQITGNSFAVTETSPNGENSEPDTGRIEISSTTNPKTIDFIDRDQPDNRSVGIYELRDGALRICMVEQGGTDVPRGERSPDVKPVTRPTTFNSPTGSNILLMEFRRGTNKILSHELAESGGGESASPHAPGKIERLSNATIYHLKDGVFIHEVFDGADHYYLVNEIVESYELTQEGLKYIRQSTAGDMPRAPVGKIAAILREPDSSASFTRLRGDEATVKRIIESFGADVTVDSVRNLTR